MAAVTIHSDFGAQETKIGHYLHFFMINLPWLDVMILVFWMLNFKSAFSLSSFTFKRLFSSSSFSALEWCHLDIWDYWYSVQFSRSVVSDTLQPHEPQHARPPCPSPTLGVYPNSCPSSRWCHPTISSSFISFSSCPQSLPASGSVPKSQLFTWGGQSIGVSASASVRPMNTQDWSL